MRAPLTPAELYVEVDDLLRTMPERATIRHDTPENLSWFGRASALIERWDSVKMILWNGYLRQFHTGEVSESQRGYRGMIVMLHQAHSDLRLSIATPTNIAVGRGMVFDYFDELRKVIEVATDELLFVDPWLDAEFIARYLPHARRGVQIRLLTSPKRLPTLLPAVDAYVQQSAQTLQVRTSSGLHDRYVLRDRKACFQSGASFKDGGRNAPTTLTQITDAFDAVDRTYETMWSNAEVVR